MAEPQTQTATAEEEREQLGAELIEELKALPYDDYLQTDHWQRVRRQALRRAGHRCHLCNSADNLNVHHRTYERLGEEGPEDVIVLCKACHARHHRKKQPSGDHKTKEDIVATAEAETPQPAGQEVCAVYPVVLLPHGRCYLAPAGRREVR